MFRLIEKLFLLKPGPGIGLDRFNLSPLFFKAGLAAAVLMIALGVSAIHSSTAKAALGDPVLTVGDADIMVGNTASVPVVLSEAPDGLSGFRAEITLDTTSAEIVGYSLPNYGMDLSEIVSGSHIVLQAADGNGIVESGASDITLAILEISGVDVGSSTASVSFLRMDDDFGNAMTVDVAPGVFTVAEEPPPVLTVGSADVNTGSPVSVPLVLSKAPDGIAGFNIDVMVGDPSLISSIAQITAIDMPDYGLVNTDLTDSSHVMLEMADLNDLINAGDTDITLASLEITGVDTGSTSISAVVNIMDDDLGNGVVPEIQGGTLNVVNVGPDVDAGPDAAIQEGQTFTSAGSFTDAPDTWTATVDYGDGSGVQTLPLNGMQFDLSHEYAEDGEYTVNVTVTDSNGAVGSDTAIVTVMNVAPTVQLPDDVILEDSKQYTGSGSFTDPGADSWNASVNYGDGSPSEQLVLNGKEFDLSYEYGSYGVYEVSVTVTDDEGASGTASFRVEVRHVCPHLPGLTDPSRDLDGDYKCEDVNGNGRLDFADLVYIFNNFQNAELLDNAEDFDFNDNGRLDMADLTTMFDMIIAQE